MNPKPTAEIDARGLRAYEQARAFENVRSRLPVTYSLAPILPLAIGVMGWRVGHMALLIISIGVALFLAVRLWKEWQRLNRQYVENIELLHQLETTYGNALSWVQMENHFAALEALEQELAEERRTGKIPAESLT